MSTELVAVARTPQAAAPPTLTVLNPFTAPSIRWRDRLYGVPEIAFTCQIDGLADNIRTRLLNLDTAPLEVWMFRDGVIAEAGFVQGFQSNGTEISLVAPGILGYLAYMHVVDDIVLTGEDQFAIGAELVDQWQSLSYGNFGIDTTGVGTSGVDRDRTYLAAEQHNVLQRLLELGAVIDGFDVHVALDYDDDTDTLDRALTFTYPERGTDLSNSVHLDARNISDAGSMVSVAPGDLASEAFGVGTGAEQEPITSTVANTTLRAAFGRTGVTGTFDGVSVQATLDDHTQAMLDARATHLFVPAPGLIPVAGAEVGDFGVGDTVTYSFDDGLGLRTITPRVAQLQVNVDRNGAETMAVAFA